MWLFLVVLVKEYLPPAVQVFQSLDPGNFYLRYESVNYLVVFLDFAFAFSTPRFCPPEPDSKPCTAFYQLGGDVFRPIVCTIPISE